MHSYTSLTVFQPYLHESRHKHAMRRPRGPGGRFLTADEIAAQKAAQQLEAGPSTSSSHNGDDDDAEQADGDLDKDLDMTLDSPLEPKPYPPIQPQQPENQREQARPAVSQLPLQPRPQPSQAIQLQSQQQQHLRPQVQSQSHSSQVQSPYNHHLSLGHNTNPINLMNVGFHHNLSHPATPVPLSPHPGMSDALQPPDHVHHDHSRHDHTRNLASSSSSGMASHMHQDTSSAQPVASSAQPASSSINLRAPYAAMQMHHVPHPHAHARHHHSYVNNVERLYTEEGNVINLPPDSLKSEMQSRADDMMHYGNGAGSSRR